MFFSLFPHSIWDRMRRRKLLNVDNAYQRKVWWVLSFFLRLCCTLFILFLFFLNIFCLFFLICLVVFCVVVVVVVVVLTSYSFSCCCSCSSSSKGCSSSVSRARNSWWGGSGFNSGCCRPLPTGWVGFTLMWPAETSHGLPALSRVWQHVKLSEALSWGPSAIQPSSWRGC